MVIARNLRGAVAACVVLIGLNACNTAPPKIIIEPNPSSKAARRQFHATQPSAALIKALIQTAQGEQRAGDSRRAAATVERALRIDPYNPELWQLLAMIRLQQGDVAQAEVMAAKSNSVVGNNHALQRDNWAIIARARRLKGDVRGARDAQRRAAAFD